VLENEPLMLCARAHAPLSGCARSQERGAIPENGILVAISLHRLSFVWLSQHSRLRSRLTHLKHWLQCGQSCPEETFSHVPISPIQTATPTMSLARLRASRLLRQSTALLLVGLLLLPVACSPTDVPADANGAAPAQSIENKGSDTLVNVALAWAETYMHQNPNQRISVTGGGSGTGIAAMINGTVDMANASREMKPAEVAAAERNDISPVEFVVARDAIAVVVHPSNPVHGLTIRQVSDMYTGRVNNWSQVGGEDRPIVLLSRESNSGTYVYFLENVVQAGHGDDTLLFSPNTLLMSSSEGISSEVRQNPNAIGYDGLGYVTSDQKTVAIAETDNSGYTLPSVSTVNDGSYPISRPLFMYTAGEPTGSVRAYLDWILDEGQILVAKLGFVPLR